MPRFFVDIENIVDGIVAIRGEDAHHIARSLRMAAGEHITVCDMQKMEYDCVLERFEDDKAVFARVLAERSMSTEPPIEVCIYQALPKADKLETVIQKAVECGAARIVPFESEYCIVKMKSDTQDKKQQRRERIAAEAAKQCGRGILPSVGTTLTFSAMLQQAAQADIALFCYEGEGTCSLKTYIQQKRKELSDFSEGVPTVSVVIGSEGGFSVKEVTEAKQAGLVPVGLGTRILRTETVATFVLGALMYEFEL